MANCNWNPALLGRGQWGLTRSEDSGHVFLKKGTFTWDPETKEVLGRWRWQESKWGSNVCKWSLVEHLRRWLLDLRGDLGTPGMEVVCSGDRLGACALNLAG